MQANLTTLPKKTASDHPEYDAIHEKIIYLDQFALGDYPNAIRRVD